MKTRTLVITVGLAVIFVLIDVLSGNKDSITTLKIYFGVYVVYLAGEFAINFADMKKNLDQHISNPLKGISGVACIEPLDEQDFYKRFLTIIKSEATNCVRISYMDRVPPQNLPDSSQSAYYDHLLQVVKSKPSVHFERVVLATDENEEWLQTMINQFEGRKNVDMYALRGQSIDRVAHPLSIQCVDEKYTILVAVAEQKEASGPRDILIKDTELTRKFNRYFDLIVRESTKVLSAGSRVDS